MEIKDDRLSIFVPNSEAVIEAQHYGIKNRTVGQYYMSEKTDQVISFLNNMNGDFFVDLLITKHNMEKLLEKLKSNLLQSSFKNNLKTQDSTLKSLDWILKSDHLHKITPPTVNEHAKYLKFNSSDEVLRCMLRLCLGDLCKIIIRKLSYNCFLIYIEENGSFSQKLDDDEFSKWEKNNETRDSI